MTAPDDYLDEMRVRRRIDDAAAEDLFAGRSVPGDLEPLATVVRALRDVSRQPVRLNAELAARIAAGTAVATAARPGAAGGQLPRTLLRVVARLAALAGRTGWPSRLAAAGAGVAVLGVGSAGFAGSLPEPVQDRFETAIESVTPYQFPDRTVDPAGERPATGEPAGPPGGRSGPGPGFGAGPGGGAGPGSGDGFGAGPGGGAGPGSGGGAGNGGRPPGEPGGQVSGDARNGGVDGGEVNQQARARAGAGPAAPHPGGPPPGQPRPTSPPGR